MIELHVLMYIFIIYFFTEELGGGPVPTLETQ